MTKKEAIAIKGFIQVLAVKDNGQYYFRKISDRQFADFCTLVDSLVDKEREISTEGDCIGRTDKIGIEKLINLIEVYISSNTDAAEWVIESILRACKMLKEDKNCGCWKPAPDYLPPAGNTSGPTIAFKYALKSIRCEGHPKND